MTTIAIDCSRLQVATDSQTTHYYSDNNNNPIKHTTYYYDDSVKLRMYGNTVFVGSGDRRAILDEWYCFLNNGHLYKKPRGEYTIALIRKKGSFLHVDIHSSYKVKCWWGTKWEVTTKTIVSDSNFITFGSGGDFAYAGLMTGLDVKEAILLASKCDPYTNDQIQFYDFNEETTNDCK